MCKTPGLNYEAFTATVRFKAQAFGPMTSTILVGGKDYRWFALGRSPEGKLMVTLNNGAFRQDLADVTLSVGEWTTIGSAVDLKARAISVWINGKSAGEISLPEDFELSVIESEAKDRDKVWTFTNYSVASTFHGWVDELILHNRVLSTEEVAKQFAAMPLKTSRVKPEAPAKAGDLAFLSKTEKEVFDLTNRERAKAGLKPLAASRKLSQAAQGHAKNMAKKGILSHTLDDIRFDQRIEATGYPFSAGGENISNAPTGKMSIEMWMDSPGHRGNMLNKTYQEIGIGHGTSADGEHYWVQVFATPIRLEQPPIGEKPEP
jgi:uncharacterized protein YkwD